MTRAIPDSCMLILMQVSQLRNEKNKMYHEFCTSNNPVKKERHLSGYLERTAAKTQISINYDVVEDIQEKQHQIKGEPICCN